MTKKFNEYSHRKYTENDIDIVKALLPRLNKKGYNLQPHDCTHLVILNGEVVGAFKFDKSLYQGSYVLRLYWLSAKINTKGVGSYIVETASSFAEKEGYIYASYNINNNESVWLFDKYKFEKLGPISETGETDSRKYLS